MGNIYLHHSVCDVCGAETADDQESLLNRRAFLRFRKQVEGIPLGVEIRAMRKAAGLTQEAAGALFGGGPVAFSKYENDDLIPDVAMANLLRLAIADPSVITKMRALKYTKSSTTTKSMSAAVFAEPSSIWTDGKNAADDEDEGQLLTEVAVTSTESFSESNGESWRVLN